LAPGEAEAECALLQQRGIVDAVLSEDVDTIMFGSGLTLRNWSPEGSLKTKVATHVNVYDAQATKAGKSGLDREGMILVALMSGGDYIPEGIPGCGPKTACEAARAGFGAELCKISKKDCVAIAAWKERLCHELKTNESKFFRSKHTALVIPEDFPRLDVLTYYTHPVLSPNEKVEKLKDTLKWDQKFDIPALRTFVGEAFDWICLSGAKKFIRNLAPAILVKELRLQGEKAHSDMENEEEASLREAKLIKHIHVKRNHVTTDGVTELRVSFVPNDLVQLDLEAEDPDPEVPEDDLDTADEAAPSEDAEGVEEPTSPKKPRAASTYNPMVLEKVWILETFVKVGAALMVEDWEEKVRGAKRQEAAKPPKKRAPKRGKADTEGGMAKGAMDAFTRITKPGVSLAKPKSKSKTTEVEDVTTLVSSQSVQEPLPKATMASRPVFRMPLLMLNEPVSPQKAMVVDLLSSPERTPRPTKRVLRRSQSDTSALTKQGTIAHTIGSSVLPETPAIELIDEGIDTIVELPTSVTVRRHRSPFRRIQSTCDTPGRDSTLTLKYNSSTRLQAHRASSPALPELTDLLQSRCASLESASTSTQAKSLPSAPSTPRRKDKAKHSVIIIGSSPETPKSQRTIKDWFVATPTPLRLMLESNSQAQLECLNEEKFPLPPISNFAANLNRRETTASTLISDVTCAKKPSVTSGATLQVFKRPKELIRLRDSLEGAWRAEENVVLNPSGRKSPEKKRKRAGVREWRVSQVEMLDLTET